MNIDEFNLTIRSHNGLRKAGITTVEDLVKLNWEQLNSIPNIGKKSVVEICWHCIQLLNGRMLERMLEWEAQYPPRHDLCEIKKKAKKYDAIAYIICN